MMNIRNMGQSIFAALLTLALIFNINSEAKAQNEYVDYDVFYNELSPYGNWYDDPEYGYVWQPRGVQNFQPYYTNGYWVMTEYGNTWVSNYNWGWAPFHYGRWTMSSLGWVWIPGTTWGPAWVDWRHGNGYYGWAPMGPNIQININFNRWNTPANWFVFVPQQNIYSRSFYGYNRPNNYMNIYNNTIIVNNYYNDRNNRPMYNYGPRRDDIRRYTNNDIPVYNVTNAQTRAAVSGPRGNNIAVYRPEVRQENRTAAPRNVRTMNGVTNNRSVNANRSSSNINNGTINGSNSSRQMTAVPASNARPTEVNRTATSTRTATPSSNNVINSNSSREYNTGSNRSNQTLRVGESGNARRTTNSNSVSTPSPTQRNYQTPASTPSRSVNSAQTAPARSATNNNSRSVGSPQTTPSRSVNSAPVRNTQPSSSSPRNNSSSSREVSTGVRR